jgi:Predicted hydrolases or acyltransferases (alpha/beta hydrolase superfamily)
VIVLAGDISIGYDDDGRGLPVVFVHGFPHNRSLWAPQLGGLAAPCRAITLDLRGFGDSTVASPYSMDRFADDIAAALAGALHAMRDRPDSIPTLATINVPTLVVVGEEDALTPMKEARTLHAGIAGSRLEVIAGAGHISNLERPAAFNYVVSEFLTSLTSQ